MTDTVPAAATSLPAAPAFDRRAFIATLTAAGVITAGATSVALASHHPDAALLVLEARWQAAKGRRDAFDDEADAALDRLVQPEIPSGLYWRRSDFLTICVDRARDCARYGDEKDARHVYESPRAIQRMRERVEEITALAPDQRFSNADREIARMQEIIDASEEYAARIKAAEDICGFTEPFEAGGRESLLIMDLLDSIIRTPARTAEGIAAKARAACSSYAEPGELETTIFPKMLAAFTGGNNWDERRRLFAISLVIDAMKLGTAPASISERSAA